MLKYLAPFVLLVLVSTFVTSQHQEHSKNAAAPPTKSRSATVAAEDAKQTEPDPKDTKWYSPSGELAFTVLGFPNGITVWALLLTMMVIAEQTRETAKSAAAARIAAEAGLDSARSALLSAHASVNSQRAHLLFVVKKVKGDRPGHSVFEISVKNFGKTPARLVGWQRQSEVLIVDTKNLPIPPVYEGLLAMESYLIPGGDVLVAVFDPFERGNRQTERMAISQRENVGVHDIQLVVYGQVMYLDGIAHERQISRYCYRFEREPFSNIGGSIEPCGGPPDYNLCT